MRKQLILSIALAFAMAMVSAAPSFAVDDLQQQEHDEATAGGPWHFRSVPCAQGTVTAVHPRLGMPDQTRFTHQDFVQSGVVAEYALPAGTAFLSGIRRSRAALSTTRPNPTTR